jgi:hypothetical protein
MSFKGIPYRPLPSQRRFHQSRARFKALCGPVGTGKSKALCQEALRLTYQNPKCMGLMGAPTLRMLRDATLEQFLSICRGADLRYEWNASEAVLTFRDTRAVVIFRSLDNCERLRGPNLAWFGVDELTYTEPEAWLRLEARLREPRARRLCGFAAFTPKGFDWVYEKFRGNAVEGYELIEAEPFENHYLLAAVPDYYERLRRSYDGPFYEQEALARFLNTRQGRVYQQFQRSAQVSRLEYDESLPLRWAWDFNVSVMSSLVCQQAGAEVLVLDELILPSSSTQEVCREFQERWGHHRGQVFVYGDASGAHGHSATGKSDYYYIRQFFQQQPGMRLTLCVPRSNPPVRDRVNTLNAKLRNAAGEQTLFVDPRCKELIKDLEQVSYKAGTGQIDKESDERRTHTSDALGYYLWYEFRPAERIGEKLGRLL